MTTLSFSNKTRDFITRLVATFTILWTPFFIFSNFRDHPISISALAYSGILFALAALIFTLIIGDKKGIRRVFIFILLVSLFLDFQAPWFTGITASVTIIIAASIFWILREHLALILATIFSTILLSSSLIPSTQKYASHTLATHKSHDNPPAGNQSKILIHIIADEFAGLPSIPEEIPGGRKLKSEIADFFKTNGFIIYQNAISEYLSSKESITSILNFKASSTPGKHFYGKHPYVAKTNKYFERLQQRNFLINVYQSTYLDYCTESPVALASCFTYRFDSTDWLRASALSNFQKMSALLSMHLNRSDILESIIKAYIKLQGALQNSGTPLPALALWDGTVAPISSMSAFDHFRQSVLDSPQGSAHFLHLLLPHSPYVYDASCSLRNQPVKWLSHHPLHKKDNSEAGRELRYTQYFDQLRCTLHQLQVFFDELKAEGKWDETEIILHGDHGSRIYETAPRAKNIDNLTATDLLDGFSTMFAVKSSQTPTILDDKAIPLSQLLEHFSGTNSTQTAPTTLNPVIYLEGKNDDPWTTITWQETK